MVLLLATLSERYSIEIDSDDITEQNFDNVEEMANLVKNMLIRNDLFYIDGEHKSIDF